MSSRTGCVFVLTILFAHAPVASAQQTIPEAVAKGARNGQASAPSGPNPSVRSLLDETDMLVLGRLGEPHSYLSDDQMEVLTDYRLNEPNVFFDSTTRVAQGDTPHSIIVTQHGGTINVQGIMYTEA